MLLYMLIGYINGFFHRNFVIEDVLLPLIVVTVDDFVFNIIVYIFAFVLKNQTHFWSYFAKIIFPEMLATALITIIIYKPYVYINKRLKR